MVKRNTSYKKAQLLWLAFLIGIVTAVCFSLGFGDSATSSAKDSNTSADIISQQPPAVRQQILRAATQGFEPSLEMKENVDFLLTPALLVQQAISEDIVITYPSE